MNISDPIADMLTRIRNASAAGLPTVSMPHSNFKNEIARILKREGYLRDYTTEGGGGKRELRLYLKYAGERRPVITGLRRISKPGLRRYAGSGEIPRVLGGMGVAVLSSSAGLLSDGEARQRHLGGEVLFYVW